MVTISQWNKDNILKFTIDNTYIEEDLVDFPVLLNISEGSGISNFDCSALFTELNCPAVTGDTFDGEDGAAPSALLWTASSTVSIQSGKLRMAGNTYIQVLSTYSLAGNFDVQVDADIVLKPSTDSWSIGLRMLFANNDIVMISRRYSSAHRYSADRYISGVWTGVAYTNTSDTVCKFKITRLGSMYSFFYWTDPVWVACGTWSGSTENVVVSLEHGPWAGNPSFTGDFDNFIINSGTIIWPTETFPNRKKIALVYPSVQEHWIEEYDKNISLLVRSDSQPNASTTFVDESEYKNVITAYNNVQHNISQAKFGTSSIYFDGVGDYLSVASSEVLNFYLNDYTMEFWVHAYTIGAAQTLLSRYTTWSSVAQFYLYISPLGKIVYQAGNSVLITLTSNTSLVAGAWYHIAITCASNTTKLFINGILEVSSVISASLYSTSPLGIGYELSGDAAYFKGYIDELIVVKGVAKYTTDFTPPTAPLEKESLLKTYLHKEQEQLYCEIEGWDQENKSVQLWTKIPKVLYNQPTDIFLYFDSTQPDNTDYIGNIGEWAAKQVWANNYMAVYHMNQNPALGGACILDSTGNQLHGTPVTMTSSSLVVAPIGKAIAFTGSNYINLPDGQLFKPTEITITTQVKINSGGNYARIFDRYYSGGLRGYCVNIGTGSLLFEVRSTAGTLYQQSNGNISVVNDALWHTFTGSYKKGYMATFFDGKNTASSYTPTADLGHQDLQVPRIGDGVYDGSINGYIAQLQVSSVARSKAWCITNELSIKDTLVNVGSANVYQFSGYVTEKDLPVVRTIYLYDRTSGELMDKCITSSTGYYTLKTISSNEHNIVCLDGAEAPNYDDLLICKIKPSEVI